MKILLFIWRFIFAEPGTLAKKDDKEKLIERIKSLTAHHHARFSTMSVQQIPAHLSDPIRVALGTKEVKLQWYLYMIFAIPGIKQLTSQVLTWPPFIPRSEYFIAEELGTKPLGLEGDKEKLVLLVEKVSELTDERLIPKHPVFGRLTANQWKRLMWRHIDVHLRNFGR
jgi:hypothetical protein